MGDDKTKLDQKVESTSGSAPGVTGGGNSKTTAASGGTAAPSTSPLAGAGLTRGLGLFLAILGVLFVYLFIVLWPAGLDLNAKGDEPTLVALFSSRVTFSIPLDARLIFLVMVAGGLGSLIHVATSFSVFVANQKFTQSWTWWYILRPFIGMVLALVFYLAIRGGFLAAGTEAGRINPYGICAMAALVGMFSKQAVDKLNEVFSTLLKTANSQAGNPVPSLDSIQPPSLQTNTTNLKISVTGKGFVKGATIQVNGEGRATQFVGETQLTAALNPPDVAKEGELSIVVVNPKPGGGPSASALKLKVQA